MSNKIDDLPLHRTWLDDIVDVLMKRPDGTADVQTIANEIMKLHREVKANPEQTITRKINDYCGDARDLTKTPRYDIFERVEPGTYRLREYPQKPDLVNIQSVKFSDRAYTRTWDHFCKIAEKQIGRDFRNWSNRKKLRKFADLLVKNEDMKELLQTHRKTVNDLDIEKFVPKSSE